MSDDLFTDDVPDDASDLFVTGDDLPDDDGHLRLPFTVEDRTAEFRLAERVGIMPLMEFAKIAKMGTRTNDLDALSAMYDFIRQAIHDDDWSAFYAYTVETRADRDELLGFVRQAIQAIAARPTRPRSSSQGGSRTTHGSSQDVSSSQVRSTDGKIPGPVMSDPRVTEFKALAAAV